MLFAFMKKNSSSVLPKLTIDRRQWGRWAVAGLLASAAGLLWKRNGIALNQQRCADKEGRIGCQQCGIFDRCGHPRALSVKQFLEKRG